MMKGSKDEIELDPVDFKSKKECVNTHELTESSSRPDIAAAMDHSMEVLLDLRSTEKMIRRN